MNKVTLIISSLRLNPFREVTASVLKKSLHELTVTFTVKTRNEGRYLGNRLVAVIDQDKKFCFHLAESSLNDMMKTANGYKVVIDCYVTEAVKYNTYNRETIVKVTKDYGTIFRDNKALFGAYDFQKGHVPSISLGQKVGIYAKLTINDGRIIQLAEASNGNNLFSQKRMDINSTSTRNSWAMYPSGSAEFAFNSDIPTQRMTGWNLSFSYTDLGGITFDIETVMDAEIIYLM